MWIVDVPGPKPADDNPPWVRLRRLPETTSEADVLEFLKETATVHHCARAVKGGVEIAVYGRRYTIVRYLSPPESP